MATFTMTLKEALGYLPDNGLQDYPIFDESHREVLNKKIIDRYWNMEIGMETPSMFRHALKRRMNEIMPMYNQLYESEKLVFDPLITVAIKNNSTSATENTSAAESATVSESDAKSRAVAQDFPQVALSGNGDYASSAQDNISDTKATGTSNEEATSKQDGTTNGEVKGFQGNAAALLMQYRESFLNIDLMIVESLPGLFMQVWSNGDEFTERDTHYGFGYYGF